ncbi:MAG: lysophospholipid acyltransferase family protein [Pseudomonadota bacterium]
MAPSEAIAARENDYPDDRPVRDRLITLVLWTYFTLGFVVFFSPLYLISGIFSRDREAAFQRLNCRFYQGFISLIRMLMPDHRWHISPAVSAIRSSVIVSNHISYLDPLLLISLFARHKTIVKGRLFRIPIFGWMLTRAGYIPSEAAGRGADIIIGQVQALPDFLAAGGNLFIFPEGTRSRDGSMGAFNPGAFKIARNCGAPIEVVHIQNTDRMFQPGRFAFRSRGPNRISVARVGRIDPPTGRRPADTRALMATVRQMLMDHQLSDQGVRKEDS